MKLLGISWWSSGWDSTLLQARAQIQLLVGKLRSCKLHTAAKKEEKKKSNSPNSRKYNQRFMWFWNGEVYFKHKKKGKTGDSDGKEFACNAGDPCSILESGRCPGGGNSYPLQYSCLENSMDRGAWQATTHGVAKSQTWLNHFNFSLFPVQV